MDTFSKLVLVVALCCSFFAIAYKPDIAQGHQVKDSVTMLKADPGGGSGNGNGGGQSGGSGNG
ncbi:MAG: hypothetical protein P1V20_06095 [Verrucomicrobiales bacterium]|nr:hypothetical protein [Verrucomicrobiales bacterium]